MEDEHEALITSEVKAFSADLFPDDYDIGDHQLTADQNKYCQSAADQADDWQSIVDHVDDWESDKGGQLSSEQNFRIKSPLNDNIPTNENSGKSISKPPAKKWGAIPKHVLRTNQKSTKEKHNHNMPSRSRTNLERKIVQSLQTSEKSNLQASESTLQREKQNKTAISFESEEKIPQQLSGSNIGMPYCHRSNPDDEWCTILNSNQQNVESKILTIMKRSSVRTEKINESAEQIFTEGSQRLNSPYRISPNRSVRAGGIIDKTGDWLTFRHLDFTESHKPFATPAEVLKMHANSSKHSGLYSNKPDPRLQESLRCTREKNSRKASNSEEIKTECTNSLQIPSLTGMEFVNRLLPSASEDSGSFTPSDRNFEVKSETENKEHHFDPIQDEKNISVSKKTIMKGQKRKK